MRRETAHQALTDYRLCKEFGWTLQELNRQPSRRIQEFLVIIREIDLQTKLEIDKAKKDSGLGR